MKAAGKCALKVMSFVTCLGSTCSYYNDLSSPLLIHESYTWRFHRPICDRTRSKIGNDFPISVFARVRGIGYYNQMSGDLHRAEVDFRRNMFDLS